MITQNSLATNFSALNFSKLESLMNASFFSAEAAYAYRSATNVKRKNNLLIKTTILDANAKDRAEVEAFVADMFANAYGAKIQHFMPHLVALRDENNMLVAAFGLRQAYAEPLFLEQYLDTSVETLLSSRLGKKYSREQITEIGNLAVANPRNAGVLIASVINYSLISGVQWCVCTAHHTLQNALIKGGREVIALQIADKTRLPAKELENWGSYYQNAPQIVAVRGVI